MENKEGINILYLCVHDRLQKKADRNGVMKRKDVFILLGRMFHVPKNLLYPILKELIYMDLVECPNPSEVRVLKTKHKISDTTKIYKRLEMY